MRKKMLLACLFVVISAVLIHAVQWQLDSAPFEFPFNSSVKSPVKNKTALSLSYSQLSGKNQILFKYNLPAGVKDAVLNVYAINGMRVGSFTLAPNSNSVAWGNSGKKAAGTYTAVLKTGVAQKTIRLVVAN